MIDPICLFPLKVTKTLNIPEDTTFTSGVDFITLVEIEYKFVIYFGILYVCDNVKGHGLPPENTIFFQRDSIHG